MENINKNIIMQAGAAVANAANKAAGLPAATPEPGSIISVIQLVNGGRTIGPDALAHFTESVRNKLLSLLVSMEPIQDFNGYGHPWPAGGGKNLYDASTFSTVTTTGVTCTNNGDGSFTLNGTASSDTYFNIFNNQYKVASGGTPLPQGSYRLTGCPAGGSTETYFMYTTPSYTGDYGNGGTNDDTTVTGGSIFVKSGYTCDNLVFRPMIRISTNGDDTWQPYSNTCPISGRTGLHVYAGPTSAIGDAATYSMTWTSPAGTVYAGSADIVTGDIKAAPYYASYNGETLVGPWVSSMDEYDPEGTPTTGAQVVDLGGTMTEYHITGQDIITLVGDNYIWSDSGDVTIKE